MLVTVFRWCLMIISCFFCDFVGEQIHRYADTQIGVPAMISNQLHEVIVGFADPPHPQRMSKLSWKYWHDKHQLKQESMPVKSSPALRTNEHQVWPLASYPLPALRENRHQVRPFANHHHEQRREGQTMLFLRFYCEKELQLTCWPLITIGV